MALIAITYVYFLIFAQFAFLNRLAELGIADTHLKLVMSAMAIGGILFSLLPGLTSIPITSPSRLRIAFAACGLAAALTHLPLGLAASLGIAFLIGAGLGLLTVTLVSSLPLWIGSGPSVLLRVGVGTGIGYWLCNLPGLFTASPAGQATAAALLCLLGLSIASPVATLPAETHRAARPVSFRYVLLAFTALVWLDSAAFFIIQNTPALKAGTWQGHLHLWTNGILHLAAAIGSAFLLTRRRLSIVLGLAVIALAIACIFLHQSSHIVLASLFYPIGVSLYSVALVAYPSLLSGSLSIKQRMLRAGLIYAIAGWFGSAMGIGMGQHLRQVPLPFVAVASSVILGPELFDLFWTRKREVCLVVGAGLVAFFLSWSLGKFNVHSSGQHTPTAVEHGREVYIAEGCIHCHSQYVRPNTADVLMWGPTQTIPELRSEHPPLIGNRRQGPDLSEVGGRRSPLWLKAHFFNPSALNPQSFMPSYGYLFQGSQRGDDLVQYVSSLKGTGYEQHLKQEQAWGLPAAEIAHADRESGSRLYGAYCLTCHESSGATRLAWSADWKRLPPDLTSGPWLHLSGDASDAQRMQSLARIIKFGIAGTDMPGHEYFSDQQIAAIASWVNFRMLLQQPHIERNSSNHTSRGEAQ
jgi:cbb3-type cytochrome oxidase cytochrome c subunit